MSKRIGQTDIAKGIGIILVVLGHSFPDSNQLAAGTLPYYIYQFIYSFHMPFFFFISGLVSAGLVKRMTREEKWMQIKKKAMRLLVPYFVIGAIFIPLRMIFAGFTRFSYDFSKLYTVFLGNNPCGQLWFLYVLFLFSVAAILFATEKNIKYLLAGSLAVTVLSPLVQLNYDGIKWFNALFMTVFYFLGLFLSQYHGKLYGFFKPKLLLLFLPAFALSFVLFMMADRYYLLKILTSVCGICVILCLSEVIDRYSVPVIGKALTEVGAYSMDVYIFHSPMGVFWRILLLRLLGVSGGVYMAVYILWGVIGSYAVSRFIVRKVPLFSLLFLGMRRTDKGRAGGTA